MPRVPLRIHTLTPNEPWWPEDERLGQFLVRSVQAAKARGSAPTMGLVARRERLQLVPMHPLAKAGMKLPLVLAGLARWNEGAAPPEAVGLVGQVRFRRRGEPWTRLALVFIEWPDGRWWTWRAPVDVDGRPIAESGVIARAVDGLPRPPGLGGWWTLARRRKPTLRLERNAPMGSPLVQ